MINIYKRGYICFVTNEPDICMQLFHFQIHYLQRYCKIVMNAYLFREKVEEMKIIQKLRERPKGVNVLGLALGENVTSGVMTVGAIAIK